MSDPKRSDETTGRASNEGPSPSLPSGLSFDTGRVAVAPKDAATILLLRPSEASIEVYCIRRTSKAAFLGGAIVFPGGKVDDADGDATLAARFSEPAARSECMSDAPKRIAIAAVRELVEEIGVAPTSAPSSTLHAMQRSLAEGTGFAELVEKHDLHFDAQRLIPFARWITPEAEARRYDARFFLCAISEGHEPRVDENEAVHGFWATPSDVLARFHRGELQLAPPTTRSLELLATAHSLDDAFALAARQSLLPVCPVFVAAEVPVLALPGDPDHGEPERRVDGPTRFALRDGRFVSEDPRK